MRGRNLDEKYVKLLILPLMGAYWYINHVHVVNSVPLSVYLLQSNLNNISFIKKNHEIYKNGIFYSVCCCFTDKQYTVVKFLFIDKMWIG